ncbi:MAG: DUF3341 domain-containing protein [Cyclobacteriaceae bacterium]
MAHESNYIVGVYDDEDILLKAITEVRGGGVKIHEVYSPFPVHGIDDVLGYKRSKLAIVAFMFGLLGTSLALTMQLGMMTVDWPMIIGGKDYAPIPSFIPVTFELTVLLASFGMVGTFMIISNLKPWGKPKLFDKRITDDKHVVAIALDANSIEEDKISALLTKSGASEVNKKTL